MKNTLLRLQWPVSVCFVIGSLLIAGFTRPWPAQRAAKLTDPPVFLETAPNDTTVNCVKDVMPADSLLVSDDVDGEFLVGAVDNPSLSAIDPCIGGNVLRIWTAMDTEGNITRDTQQITILADTAPPVINLQPVNDTISCDLADYDTWINDLRISIGLNINNAFDDCSGIDDIDDDAPPKFDNACGTLVVTFTVTDSCGWAATWEASFTTLDTVAPVFVGVPAVNDTISCETPIPAAPAVTATDNCASSLVAAFQETSTQVLGTCNEYTYHITRTWTVTDDCGNSAMATHVVFVRDITPPDFTVPPQDTISCSDDPDDLMLTGFPTNLSDNCSPLDSLEYSYTDGPIQSGSCPNSYQYVRTWRLNDVCNNVRSKLQTIIVIDDEAPDFTPPSDITVDCADANDLALTGEPADVSDNCDPNPVISMSDVVIPSPGGCPHEYTIRRTWTVTDTCGNAQSVDQFITVIDNIAPTIETAPQFLVLNCTANLNVNDAFTEWINTRGGAQAEDNCSEAGDLTWEAFNAGTNVPATLIAPVCPAGSDTILMRVVDFVVSDECGNRDTTTASFYIVDNAPPSISQCPEPETVSTDLGVCTATYTLEAPLIEDACAVSFTADTLHAMAPITSNAAPGQEGNTPVNPITLQLAVSTPLPVNAAGTGTLLIQLLNADAEESTEYFRIVGEDGSQLGITNPSLGQCGASVTSVFLSIAQINNWALDGTITIQLVPNIPNGQPGSFAINAICQPPGQVIADLYYTIKNLSGITYSYSIDNGARIVVDPVGPTSVVLSQGANLIGYFAGDCSGRTDSCAYIVTVADQEPPVLSCPSDMVVSLATGECTAEVTLPLPAGATDNCAVYNDISFTVPEDTTSALLTFNYDPNLNEYLANNRVVTFNNVVANAFGNVTLQLDMQGDFSSNQAYIRIKGEDGSLIGATNVGVAGCGTPGQQSFSIPAATFNAWAADGSLTLTLEPNPITVPPGVAGDGISPCNAIGANGETDGVTYVFATINYQQLTPAYFAQGATTLPLTNMQAPAYAPTHVFNRGETTVSYIVRDAANNADTCTFKVIVEDNEAPQASCQPTTLFINPSGLDIQTVDPTAVDAGSADNCGISAYSLSPNTFTCNQAGSVVNVTLTVTDFDGNTASCNTIVAISPETPMPTANSGLCGGDTLFLFANPPPAVGGVVFTYRWFNPQNQLISTVQNPVIPNIGVNNEGPYRVEIRGITGCIAENVVNVNIENLPLTPQIQTTTSICSVDDISLTSSIFPVGNNVMFHWYEGTPPNGVLLASTAEPTYILPGPHALGTRSFYLTVEANDCISPPSAVVNVTSVLKPIAMVAFADTIACGGTSITLGTIVAGPGITYSWTGPNNFMSTSQFPTVGPLAGVNEGYYYLTVIRNGCESEPDSTRISVKPKPETPTISSNTPICAGGNVVLTTNASGASGYHWINNNNQEFLTAIPVFTIPNATPANSGTWRVFVTKNGCDSDPSAPIEVVVNPVPDAAASANPVAVCEGSSLQLFASPIISDAIYEWTGPDNFVQVTPNPTVNNMSAVNQGIYRLRITTQAGCTDTASVAVSVLTSVAITGVSSNAPSCLNGPTDIQLVPSVFPVGAYNYLWTGPNNFMSTSQVATIPGATAAVNNGNYTLVVTTAQGCASQSFTYLLNTADAPAAPTLPLPLNGQTQYCVGDQVRLSTNSYSGNAITYFWQAPGLGVVPTPSPLLQIDSALVSNTGDFSVYVIVNGCISPVSPPRPIAVYPIPQITATSNSPVCSGETLMLEAQFLQNASYVWNGPGFTLGVYNPVIPNANPVLHSGTYRVAATLNGCTSDTLSLQILVKPRPQSPVIANNGPICISDPSATLELSIAPSSATQNANYTWYGSNGVTPVSVPSGNLNFLFTDFTGFTEGTYAFYAGANLDGCASPLSAPTLAVFNAIPANQAYAGADTTVCDNPITNLQAAAPSIGSGLWTLVAAGDPTGVTIANPNQPGTTANGLSLGNGPYTFRWTLSNGACANYSFDDVTIAITQGDTAEAGDNFTICQGELVNLAALPPASPTSIGVWSQPIAQQILGVGISNTSDPSTIVSGLEPDNLYSFTWTITGDCGVSSDEVFITVSSDPDGGADAIACNNTATGQLSAGVPTLGSTGHWTALDPNVIITSPQNRNTPVSNLQPGENYFIWTIDNALCGPASQDTVVILYKKPPIGIGDVLIVPFGEDLTYNVLANDTAAAGTTIEVIGGPALGSVQNLGNGDIRYTPPANFVGIDELTYQLNSEGCETATAVVSILVGEDAACKIPSIFTPNNDGVNDALVIPCLLNTDLYPNSKVRVFNRWGDEVFTSAIPYGNDWNGTFNGEDLPDDTYFFIVDLGNGNEPTSGWVMIQR